MGGYAAGGIGHCEGYVAEATVLLEVLIILLKEALESGIEAEVDGVSRGRRERRSSRQGI